MTKNISALDKNPLAELIILCGKATASLYASLSLDALEIGINLKVIDMANQIYNQRPVIECSDKARTLRFISPCKM